LFLLAITFIAYQPVWHAGFIWDDDSFLTNNPVIKDAQGLYRLWFTASTPDYFPMTSSMLWLEWRIWGAHPLGYHLVNVLLHALSAVLLWRVLRRLRIPGAILAAALFALHPVNVQSVAWITERKNTLAMLFYMATLLAWLKFEDSGRPQWRGLALGGFTLALLSKTAVAPLPIVLLAIGWWRRGRIGWQDARRIAPFFVIAAGLGLVTIWFQSQKAIAADVVRADDFWSRLAGAGWAAWFYLYKAVLPLHLAFVYPRWKIDARNLWSYLPLALLAASLILCWRLRRNWGRAVFFALAYFVLLLLPVLGFVNIYFMRYSLVADHWQYFAIIGPITLFAAPIRKPALAAAILLALGAMTWRQCGNYVDEETLWQATLRLNPQCWMAHGNVGDWLDQKGMVDAAIAEYQTALRLQPDYAPGHNNLGIALGRKGRTDEALAEFQRAAQLDPAYASAHNNLGNALLDKGRAAEAIMQYQEALQIKPGDGFAHVNLGIAFQKTGRAREAIGEYQKALELLPGQQEAETDLAWLMATGKEDALRNGRKAVELAQQANTQSGGENPTVLHTLAAALAETGQFDEAMKVVQKAVALAQASGKQDLVKRFDRELKSYQARLPLRE
jgi:tetratricopeptide (TPR) repeat protein